MADYEKNIASQLKKLKSIISSILNKIKIILCRITLHFSNRENTWMMKLFPLSTFLDGHEQLVHFQRRIEKKTEWSN